MSNANVKSLEAQLAAALAENAALKARPEKTLSLKVSEKGAVSIYGMGRFPMTAYAEQWEKVLAMAKDITAFIEVNRKSGKIISKAQRQALEASAPVAAPGSAL